VPLRTREHHPPTEQWHQLTILLDTPGQRSSDAIRPAIVFGEPIAVRAATQLPARTLAMCCGIWTAGWRAPAASPRPISRRPR
jgi:hypothetical protein